MKNNEGIDACQKRRQYSDGSPGVRTTVTLEKPPEDNPSGVPIEYRIRIMAA